MRNGEASDDSSGGTEFDYLLERRYRTLGRPMSIVFESKRCSDVVW